LLQNSNEVPLADNEGLSKGKTYAQDTIHEEALKFIRANRDKPFFAYLPYTPPHGSFDIPDTDPAWALYKDKPWPEPVRRYAAMVTMLDRQVGEIVALLKDLGLEKNTLVMFSGDNGGADYFSSADHPRGFHSANKHPRSGLEYRGKKGNLYEGGLRVPCLAYWPGTIAPGRTTDRLSYFPDILPTFAELAGAKSPAAIDGLSLVPTLLGEGEPKTHDFLYWEFNGWIAIRQGDWRAVRPPKGTAWELYDLKTDPGESKDVAAMQPAILRKLQELAETAHEPAKPGQFSNTANHERDRRAKYGKHDDPSYYATPSGISKKRTDPKPDK
jgi:arylsulfatase A-like enzyme